MFEGIIIWSQVKSKLLFDIVVVNIEIFVILAGEYSNGLFVEGCRLRAELDLRGALKLFVSAEVMPSQTSLQLSKKVKVLNTIFTNDGHTCILVHFHHEHQFGHL
ncbi:hypothetical protein AVEN_225069-1 [Araneus ventricosus]|uniref:Uncharacterized protein n=1 Tax=Araneus ventricosus TaxID=182803 RepID=A0A4Y2JC90_ARAVE|nr:hypothetical protein AVEN_225069-1 [Araneus ventricosus]